MEVASDSLFYQDESIENGVIVVVPFAFDKPRGTDHIPAEPKVQSHPINLSRFTLTTSLIDTPVPTLLTKKAHSQIQRDIVMRLRLFTHATAYLQLCRAVPVRLE